MKKSNGKLGAASAMFVGGALGAILVSLENYYLILVVIILLTATLIIPDKYLEELEDKIKNS